MMYQSHVMIFCAYSVYFNITVLHYRSKELWILKT